MSKQQRETIDEMLWQPRPEGPQTVAAMRAGFAAMFVSDQIRTTTVTLGARRRATATRHEPEGSRTGTAAHRDGPAGLRRSRATGILTRPGAAEVDPVAPHRDPLAS